MMAGNEILGTSDTSKKGVFAQRGDTFGHELRRASMLTFSSHMLNTVGFMHAGIRMARLGKDKATKKEGRRLFATALGQNMLFSALNYSVISYGFARLVRFFAGFGLNDEEEEELQANIHQVIATIEKFT